MNLLSTLFSNEKLIAALPQISLLCVFAAGKLGLVMPLIVSALSQPRFTKAQRAVLSVASCLAASAILCLAAGAFSGINWMASLVVLLLMTWGLYARFYKPTGIAPWFERATDMAKLAPLVLGLLGTKATGAFAIAQTEADTSLAASVPSTPAPAADPSAVDPTPDPSVAPDPAAAPASDSSDSGAGTATDAPADASSDAVADAQTPAPDAPDAS